MTKLAQNRWFRFIVLYFTVFFGLSALFVLGVEIHSSLILPAEPTGWNAKQIKTIQANQKKLKDPEHFCFAVLGDNRGSIRTFNKIIDKMNQPQLVEDSANVDKYTK
ncbi:MAG TPA: hypothetical protein VIK02_07525 [Candidatus Anoxymicrobiaceae bacterium]